MATIGTHYILSALGGAKKKGIDTRQLLKNARISELQLKNPRSRFPVESVAKLYSSIASALNDEFMGFTEHPLKVGAFALMAEWVSYGHNLEELFARGIRFYNQITNEVTISLHVEGDHVYFTSEFKRPELDFEHFFIEYWHVIWHRFASWYIGKPIKLINAYINYTPIDHEEFELLFRCRTNQKSKYNRLVFHRSYLEAPLVKTPRDLKVFLARAPIDLLTIPGEDNSLTASIQQALEPKTVDIHTPIKLPNSQELAARFNMSEQTLRRKLHLEGVSYQQIKDNIRLDLAYQLLAKRNISIKQISHYLNFSEPRAFSRAFTQWTSETPRAYRHKQLK